MKYIVYGLIPVLILAWTYMGMLVGKWCDEKEGKPYGGGIGCFIGIAVMLILLALGSSTDHLGKPEPPNIEGMVGISFSSLLTFVIVVVIDYVKKTIDVKKTVDKKVEEELKKRKLENEIFLRKEGL